MPPRKPNAEEYPVSIVDLSDDFKSSTTIEVKLDEERTCFRYWIFLNCMKWQIEIRATTFECFAAYFKPPATWSAEVEFEIRAHITSSLKSDRFTGRFSGANHVYFRQLRLHEYMMKENMASLKIEISLNVIKMTNFGMMYDYFEMMPQTENALLKVEDRLIRVNKQYLALMSPFFKALFYGEHSADEELYELKEEKFKEVLTFLRCIYPHRQGVSKKSVDFLLDIADRWQCQPIVDACEMFMCAHYHEYQKRTEKCFSYVEKYKMQRLLRIIVEYVTVTQTPASFRNQPYYRDLSEKTQLSVLDYMARNQARRGKEIERRRGVHSQRANIDPMDDQDPPTGRLMGIAHSIRHVDPRPQQSAHRYFEAWGGAPIRPILYEHHH